MTTRKILLSTLLTSLLLGFVLPSTRLAVSHAQDAFGNAIVIVVARGFRERDISSAMLRRAFRGDTTEFGGSRLVPFNYAPEHPVRRVLDTSLLGLPPDQVSAYWIDRRIRGEGLPPRTVPSPLIMRAVVAKLPGAIGYLPAALVDSSVTVLTVDGKGHRSSDYPLHAQD
jgi:hypothetical protein